MFKYGILVNGVNWWLELDISLLDTLLQYALLGDVDYVKKIRC